MNSEESFDLIIEELRSTNDSALKNFRICLVILALMVSVFGVANNSNNNLIANLGGQWEFYLGFGFLLSSMFFSIVISMNRWGESDWFNFDKGDLNHDKVSEILDKNRLNLMMAQVQLLLSIIFFGTSIDQAVDIGLINFSILTIPLIFFAVYFHYGLDQKILSKVRLNTE